MTNFFILLLVTTVLVEASVELICKSKFFIFFRDFLARPNLGRLVSFFNEVVVCPYCLSVWISFFYTSLISLSVLISGISFEITGIFIIDSFIFFVLAHRLSNQFHNFCDKHLDKFYSAPAGREKK